VNKNIKKKLLTLLKKVKVKKNSTIFLHAGLNYLTKLSDVNNKISPEEILDTLKEYCGKNSTIIFPAFFYDFSRKNKIFNILKSPPSKSLGSLTQYIFKNEKFYRSKHPLTSLIGIGKKAKIICAKTNSRDYGYGSAWHELVKQNAQLLFLGVPMYKANTFIHYIEFQLGVPHMYIKKFNNKIIYKDRILDKEVFAYVRYLNNDVNVDQIKFYNDLKKEKCLKSLKLGKGEISSINIKELLNFGLKKLEKWPYYFLRKKPKFKKNLIPLI